MKRAVVIKVLAFIGCAIIAPFLPARYVARLAPIMDWATGDATPNSPHKG
jgi:hypothetical protein